jgi:hypothetical protein
MKAKDSSKQLLEQQVEKEREQFILYVEKVRALLKERNALDLEEMLLSGLENGPLVSSLPSALNGRK